MRKNICLLFIFPTVLLFNLGCEKRKKFEVAEDSSAPGSIVKWGGESAQLSAPSVGLQVGKVFPEISVMNSKMKEEWLRFGDGKVRIINVVPSVDTPVCEEQNHLLAESKTLNPAVEKMTVSMDLPFAQKRFVEVSKLKGIQFYSDYLKQDFGKKLGLLVDKVGLLARAVVVVDADGVVRYIQVTPEVSKLPDMEKAFQMANQLVVPGSNPIKAY